MKASLLAVAALVLAGCTAAPAPAPEPVAPASGPEVDSPREPIPFPVSYRGQIAPKVCTFGSLRHQCEGSYDDSEQTELPSRGSRRG